MKKVYAVRKGRRTGLFTTWAECEAQVKGYNGAEYKSFPDNKSALEFLNKERKIVQDSDEFLKVYVDGSYSKKLNTAGYGCIFVNRDKVIHEISQKVSIDPEENLWNVSAEIEGVLAGVKWAIEKNYKDVSIYYDYEGLEKWFDGSWKANKKTTKSYIEQMKLYDQKVKIRFFKVKAHSGDYFNEMVDNLAKSSLNMQSEKKLTSPERYINLSLSEFEKIVGKIENEECLVHLGEFKVNDYALKRIAKSFWRNHKYLVKDMGEMNLSLDASTSIIDLEILHKKEKPTFKVQIKLESDKS